jgi:hypothetical protein
VKAKSATGIFICLVISGIALAQAIPIITAVRDCPRLGSIEVQVYPAGEVVWAEGGFRNSDGLEMFMERTSVSGSGTKTIYIEYDHPLLSGDFDITAWRVKLYSSRNRGEVLFDTGWQTGSWSN